MEGVALLALIMIGAAVVFIAWLGRSAANKRRQEARIARMRRDADAFFQEIRQANGLQPIATNLLPKRGELVFWEGACDLYETRAVRHYESGSAGFRVAKGVYLGRTQGRSVSTQEWQRICTGRLSVSNQRIVFDGATTDRTLKLDKIISLNCMPDGIEVSVENRQKSMVFTVDNPVVINAIVHICRQAKDPTDLEGVDLQFVYQE